MRKPDWLVEIEHTADTGITVRAKTRATLFERAAWGMFFLITDLGRVRPADEEAVTVEAADAEALLVRWLSELVFRHETRGRLFCRFDVEALDETRLRARVAGEALDETRHRIRRHIKAVTYHGLTVAAEGAGFRASVIFDV